MCVCGAWIETHKYTYISIIMIIFFINVCVWLRLFVLFFSNTFIIILLLLLLLLYDSCTWSLNRCLCCVLRLCHDINELCSVMILEMEQYGMMYDVWCMMYGGVWCMMYDVWCMYVWCMMYVCMYVRMYDVWCMMYDVWGMMYDVYISCSLRVCNVMHLYIHSLLRYSY